MHGGDIYSYGKVLDFSANVNPLGTPKLVEESIRNSIPLLGSYPDNRCRKLRREISKVQGIPSEYIFCGNGASEVIYRFVLACFRKKHKAGEGLRALLPVPAFSEYEQALRLCAPVELCYYKIKPDTFQLDEDLLLELTRDLDVLFLCSPNNPTGVCIPQPLLHRVLDVCFEKQIRVFLDESFLDFCEDGEEKSARGRLLEDPNLFLLKSFTKLYALAGLRLGYGMCADASLLCEMEECGPPWSVSIPAQEAGCAALSEKEFVKKTREFIQTERNFLISEMERLGIRLVPGEANYILFQAQENLGDLLLKQGILVRDCSDYVGLTKGYYRIAVRSREENERLIRALGFMTCI